MGDDRETYTGNDRETVYVHRVFSGKVDCCADCPYYEEDNQMGAILISCAALPGKGYDKLLDDISWRDSSKKISQRCPFR